MKGGGLCEIPGCPTPALPLRGGAPVRGSLEPFTCQVCWPGPGTPDRVIE